MISVPTALVLLIIKEHFFFHCDVVKMFWVYIEKELHCLTGKRITLTVTDVLFGLQEINGRTKDDVNVINHVIALAKMSISIKKKTDSKTPIHLIFD